MIFKETRPYFQYNLIRYYLDGEKPYKKDLVPYFRWLL